MSGSDLTQRSLETISGDEYDEISITLRAKQGDMMHKTTTTAITTTPFSGLVAVTISGPITTTGSSSTITFGRPLTLTPVISTTNSSTPSSATTITATINKNYHVPRGPAVVASLNATPRTAVATPIRAPIIGTTQLVRTVIPNRSQSSSSLILQNPLQWQKIRTTVINATSIPRPVNVTAASSAQIHTRTQLITKNPIITTQNRQTQQIQTQNIPHVKAGTTISLAQVNTGLSRTPTVIYTTTTSNTNTTNYLTNRAVSNNSHAHPIPITVSKSLVQTMTPKPLTITNLGSTKITIAPVSQTKIPVSTTLTVTGTQNARVTFSNAQSNLFTRMSNNAIATTNVKTANTSNIPTAIIGNSTGRLTTNVLQLQNVIVSNNQGTRSIPNTAKVTFPMPNTSIQISQINKPTSNQIIPITVNMAGGSQKTVQIDKTIGSTTITPLFYDQNNKNVGNNSAILSQVIHSKNIPNHKPLTVLSPQTTANIRLAQARPSTPSEFNKLPKITMPNTSIVITTLAPTTITKVNAVTTSAISTNTITITSATPTISTTANTTTTSTSVITPVNSNLNDVTVTVNKLSNSPRPTILRKRDTEVSVLRAAKNLTSLFSNYQSSLSNSVENNVISNNFNDNISTSSSPLHSSPDYFDDSKIMEDDRNWSDASPRKKPRKQQLTIGEVNESKLKTEQQQQQQQSLLALKDNNNNKTKVLNKRDDDIKSDVQIKNRRQASLLNSYHQTWKATNNHFIKPTDVRPKTDKKKASIIDIANQANISKKLNGWRIYYLAAEIIEIKNVEHEVYESLKEAVNLENCKEKQLERKFDRVIELIKGNYQRSKIIEESLETSRNTLYKMFDHKVNINDIISRCDGKRSFKKRNLQQ